MATKSRPGAANLVRGRFARRGALGAGGSNPLTAIAPWRIGTTRWRNARWGAKDWLENAINYSQVVDIDIPEGTPPPGGWPCLGRAHAAQGVHTVPDGSSIDTMVRSVALANGIAFITFAGQHPYLSATPEVMPDDVPEFWAWFQQLAPYLGIDPHGISFFTQSRGSMVLEAALRNPLVDPELMWCINPQFSYRPLVGYNTLLATPADIAAALAAEPDDPRQNSAFLEVATAARVPKLVALHEGAYWQRKISFAEYGVWSTHTPDQGLYFRDEYKKRGMQDRIVVADQVSGNANTMADIVPTLLMVRQGVPLPEAVALARAYRRGHAVHYLKDLTGVTKQQDGSGGTPAQGDVIGRIVDGRFGIANRSAVNPLGNPAGNIGTVRPRLQGLPNGGWAARFDADDKLICPMTIPNTASYGFAWWDSTSFNSVPSQVSGTQIAWGYPNTDQVLAVVADAPLLPSELRIYSQLAGQLAGVDLFGTIDKVTAAGALYVANPKASYQRPGLTCTRAGSFYLPQQDGSLTLVPDNTPGRYWDKANGCWLYWHSPGWTNSFCNKSVGGGLTLGVGTMSGLSGRLLNKATVPAGTFSYAQVGGANTHTFAAAQGQSVDLSFQGYVGAPTGPMSLGLNVVNALTTGLSSNAAYNGFKISATGVVFGKFLAGGVTELQAPLVEQVAPGLWKFSWLLRYTQGATVRDNTRMYLEVLDSSGAANNVTGDGVSAVYWELCQHSLTGYHPPLADTATAPVTVGSPTWGGTLAGLNIALGSEFSVGVECVDAFGNVDKVPFGLSNGTFGNSIYFIAKNGSSLRSASMISSSAAQLEGMSAASLANGARSSVALRVRGNDSRAAFNGALAPLDSACTLPVGLSNLRIGGAPWGGSANDFAGGIGSVWVAPVSALSDAQLQAIGTL